MGVSTCTSSAALALNIRSCRTGTLDWLSCCHDVSSMLCTTAEVVEGCGKESCQGYVS